MTQKKVTPASENQLVLFGEKDCANKVHSEESTVPSMKRPEVQPAKVIHLTPNLSDIYERILNRTMS